MSILGYDEAWLKEKGAIHTAAEIAGQPELWLKTYSLIAARKEGIEIFLKQAVAEASRIILTGAGTSAYIGLSLHSVFGKYLHRHTYAIPTTDLVSHPADYFFQQETLLLISFARSGNSPESTAAVALADKLCGKVYHLIITCDPEGQLAKYPTVSPRYNLVLPPESNDQGLAMTGSYTSMLLAGFLTARIDELETMAPRIETLYRYGRRIFDNFSSVLRKVASMEFKRAVFLGSGPLFGTATESQLKLQELTDGTIVCKNDTFLGFRHGPKAVIDETTLVVFIFSNDPYAWQYERDLVLDIRKGRQPMMTIGLFEVPVNGLVFDLDIQLSEEGSHLEEALLAVCDIIPGQLLGFYKSLALNLSPDNPSVSGAISRVVENVYIYPYSNITVV